MKREFKVNWTKAGQAALTAAVLAVSLCAGAALLLSLEWMDETWANYAAAVILAAASFAGGMMAAQPAEAVIGAAEFWLLLLGVNAVGYGWRPGGAGEGLLAILGGCGAAVLFRGRKKSTRGRRRKTRFVKLNKTLG